MKITDEELNRLYEPAKEAAAMCNEGKACPTPIYCGCPFKHVLNMPEDCKRTTVSQWVILLMKLSKLEGTIPLPRRS